MGEKVKITRFDGIEVRGTLTKYKGQIIHLINPCDFNWEPLEDDQDLLMMMQNVSAVDHVEVNDEG